MNGRPALFLDRDGVINIDRGYVSKVGDFVFVPGIFDLCRAARRHGYFIFVITNQAGIGRGYYTEDDFWALTDWMCAAFEREDAAIDKVYFCPTHPVHGLGKYKSESNLRKPAPGMILQAAREFGIDLGRSLLVGDKISDIAAGVGAGVASNFLYGESAGQVDGQALECRVVARLADVIPFLVPAGTEH